MLAGVQNFVSTDNSPPARPGLSLSTFSTKKHDVPEELLSSLLANYKKPEDLIGESVLPKQLTKILLERALDAELTEHLGHERNETVANHSGNTRNGKSKKTLKGDFGELPIQVLPDHQGIHASKNLKRPSRHFFESGFQPRSRKGRTEASDGFTLRATNHLSHTCRIHCTIPDQGR